MKLSRWAFACLLFHGSHALAADMKFRGYASFTGGKTLGSDESLYNYSNEINFRNDSLIALQTDTKLDEGLSATMQLIARGKNDYKPIIEWAYVSYDINENIRLNAGRIRIPFYRYSDFIDVRYTYNWLQPPKTVYGFDFPGYDGISLVHTKTFGSWDSTVQFIYGRLEGELNGTPVILDDLTGFNWTVNSEWLTLRAGYMRSNTNIEISNVEQLASGVDTLGKATKMDLSKLSSDIRLNGDNGTFGGLALGIDYNNYLFDAEYITYKVDNSLLAKTDAYYTSFGYRLDKWIPLLTVSKSKSDAPTDLLNEVPAPLMGIPFGPASFGQVIGGAVAATEQELDLIDFTLRYDFHGNAALKVALTQTDNNKGEKNKLLRFGVDMVF
ncbi:MAG: porin [Marinagarivorans sp.]